MIRFCFKQTATTREYKIPVTLTKEDDGIDKKGFVYVIETNQYVPFQDHSYEIKIPEDLKPYIKEEDFDLDEMFLPF